jgi:hypothetical protein
MYLDRYSLAVHDVLSYAVCSNDFDATQLVAIAGVLTDWWHEPISQEEGTHNVKQRYIVGDDRRLWECGSGAVGAAQLLEVPRSLSNLLDEILSRSSLERLLLIRGFQELVQRNLVRAVPSRDAAQIRSSEERQ